MAVAVAPENAQLRDDGLILPGVQNKTVTRNRMIRLNLVLSDRSATRLETLKGLTEASSYTEVIRNAIRLYEAIIMEYEKGNKVQIIDKNGTPLGISIF